MAIDILHRGHLPEDEIFKGTCYNCKTVFECLKSDGMFHSGSQMDGPYVIIVCPVCGKNANAYGTNKYKGRFLESVRSYQDSREMWTLNR